MRSLAGHEMEDEYRDWLAGSLWPWPITVAYTLQSANREVAIANAGACLELYPTWGELLPEYTAIAAMTKIAEALGATSSAEQNALLLSLEKPLLSMLENGALVGWARDHPGETLKEREATSWFGGEIVYNRTCDLAPYGTRSTAGSGGLEGTPVRFVDIWITRDSILQAFPGRGLAEDNERAIKPAASLPRLGGRWVNRVPTDQARLVERFFEKAGRHLAGGSDPKNPTELRRQYVDWIERHHKGAQPYGRSMFEEHLRRFEDGWRVRADGKGMEHLPD